MKSDGDRLPNMTSLLTAKRDANDLSTELVVAKMNSVVVHPIFFGRTYCTSLDAHAEYGFDTALAYENFLTPSYKSTAEVITSSTLAASQTRQDLLTFSSEGELLQCKKTSGLLSVMRF